MTSTSRICIVLGGLLAAATAHAQHPPDFEAYHYAPALSGAKTAAPNPPLGTRVTAFDDQRGLPRILWAHPQDTPAAPAKTAEDAARWYLGRLANTYRLSRTALANAYVHRVDDTGRGGIIVTLRQRVGGVDVLHTELSVLLDRDLRLVAVTGNLHPEARDQAAKTGGFALDRVDAVRAALADLYGVDLERGGVRDLSWHAAGYEHFELVTDGAVERAGIHLSQPARVKAVYYPMPDRLVPGYFVEFFSTMTGGTDADAFAYVVGAAEGEVLSRRNLTASDAVTYRVWADTDGLHTPLDGPIDDFTPHPTGVPGLPEPGFVDPALITIEGFNTNPDGGVDPWLPEGTAKTRGNNIDAYVDHFAPDGFTEDLDHRAQLSGPGIFDYSYDHSISPFANDEQTQAAITQIFYTTNWLHDYFYDSGFDEAAGNAQQDNFGRGGVGGDVLRAEAQDSAPDPGVRNNANMSTPADGVSPRMQMFLWRTPDRVRGLDTFGNPLNFNTASFGPTEWDVDAPLVETNDGVDAPGDGCQPPQNDVEGAIVLIDRGACAFALKAQNVENAGAVGVIIANNVPDAGPPGMGNTNPPLDIGIPVVSVTFEDGAFLHAKLDGGRAVAAMARAADIERDGTIDNAIVAHEWGHYIHNRLVLCNSTQCRAMGEGWGDFVALHMMIREGDDFHGAYAMSIYATRVLGDNAYFGIRRIPYSAERSFNALSFRHISDGEPLPDTHPIEPGGPNSEVHNAGEIWTSMLMDGYVSLLDQTVGPTPRYSFEEARRRMADYIVAGMKLAPAGPTYTEQRDAILAAALARDPDDMLLLAQAFAGRGAGSCAQSPPRSSSDFTGVVEDDSLRATMRVDTAPVDDQVDSCDDDGVLDGGEVGLLRISVDNPSPVPLIGTTVTVSSTTPGISFPNGDTVALADVGAFGSTSLELAVALADGAIGTFDEIALDLTLTNPDTCETTVTHVSVSQGEFDLAPSQSDDVESPVVVWSEDVAAGGSAWTRVLVDGDHAFHGADLGTTTDVSWVSPPLQVSAGAPFVVAFSHRYEFEFDGVAFDGAVIELSTDGGDTFTDVNAFVDPGYDDVIFPFFGNPLGGREGFAAQSPGFPDMVPLTLDFGAALAGQTVVLRFRIGTDGAVGAPGWEIDDVAVSGIDNAPFLAVVDDNCLGITGSERGGGVAGSEDKSDGAPTPTDSRSTGAVRAGGCSAGGGGESGAPAALVLLLLGGLIVRRRRV
ncbi:M36 family metallopeptidase [Haliangium sp.]|uniref:M36 family metallopeptidase n=1 Tax=Haliangium sp. TaxID=2663208 RepID=UPI003D126BAC